MKSRLNRRETIGLLGAFAAGATLAIPARSWAAEKSVVLVATQKAGDQGPIDALIAGLGEAEKRFGVKTRFIEALDAATYETTIRTLAQRGTDVIITTFFGMVPVVKTVAPEFPNTKFVIIVGSPIDPPLPNVRVTVYATHENAYLSGVFGAHVTDTKKLAYINGVALPFAWADFNAYTAAAQTIDPAIKTSAAFVQSYQDPVKGREIAAGLYSSGVDGILTSASGSDVGVVEAAKDANALVMPPSPALIADAPKNVGFVATFEWARTLLIEVKNALSDHYQNGFRVGNVKSGEIIVVYSPAYYNAADAKKKKRIDAAKAAVSDTMDKLKSGAFTVKYDTTAH
jgi:basic membrane protein A and related proteins